LGQISSSPFTIVIKRRILTFLNSLRNWKPDIVPNKKEFIQINKSVLIVQSCYLVNDFLDSCEALWESERWNVYDRKDRNTTYSDILLEIMFEIYVINNTHYLQEEVTKSSITVLWWWASLSRFLCLCYMIVSCTSYFLFLKQLVVTNL
jgi:hypothetical protein